MAALMNRLRGRNAAHVPVPEDDWPMQAQEGHNGRRALRGWRVVLDKIFTIMTLVALQEATAEWQLPPQLSQPFASEDSSSIEDVYAEVIIHARVLAPLKSKEPPSTSASSCVHPKRELRGGGNASLSYITCRACHSRWEAPFRAAELKKMLKEENKGQIRGSLGQSAKAKAVAVKDMVKEKMERNTGHAASSHQTMPALKDQAEEMRQMMMEAREREIKQEALLRTMLNMQESMQRSPPPSPTPKQSMGPAPARART